MNSPVQNDFPGVSRRDLEFARRIVEQFHSGDGIDSPVKLGGQARAYHPILIRTYLAGFSPGQRRIARLYYHQVC